VISSALFLFFALGALWATQNALRGPGRSRIPLLRPLWLPAMLAAELLPIRVAVHLGLVALFVAAGALGDPVGWVALGVSLATIAGSAWIQARARRAGTAMDAALDTAGIPPTDPPRIRLPRLTSGYPYQLPVNVAVEEDVPYAPALTLDVYRDRSLSGPRPALLQIHGGSWTGGDRRRQARPLLHRLAADGWTALSASYPLSPTATFPDQLIGLKRALAWMRGPEGRAHGVDPDTIVVTGGSAGGHLAALVALTANRPGYQPGFAESDTSVAACITFYGIFDFLNRGRTRDDWPVIPRAVMKATPEEDPAGYAAASPIDQVHPDAPPFLVIHGSHDSLVPAAESRAFVAALRKVSRDAVAYAEIPGATHGFDAIASVRTHHVLTGIERFLTWVVERH
jgi:acetyl esterase/lipase